MAEAVAETGRAALRTLAGTLTAAIAVLLWLKRPDDAGAGYHAVRCVVVCAAVCAALGAFAFPRASTTAIASEWLAIGMLAAVSVVLLVSIGFVFLIAASVIFLDLLTMDDDEPSPLSVWQHLAIPAGAFGATMTLLIGTIAS